MTVGTAVQPDRGRDVIGCAERTIGSGADEMDTAGIQLRQVERLVEADIDRAHEEQVGPFRHADVADLGWEGVGHHVQRDQIR